MLKHVGISKLPQSLGTSNSPTFQGMTVSGLTASRLMATTAGKALSTVDLTSYVAGTANQVTVASNGSGGVTLSLPQAIDTAATMTLFRTTLQTNTAGNSASLILRNYNPDGSASAYVTMRNVNGTQWIAGMGVSSAAVLNYQVLEYLDGNYQRVAFTVQRGGNALVNTSSAGTNLSGGLVLGTGAAPTSSPADIVQCYSADIGAGHAALHVRNENGTVLKLHQQALVAAPTGGATQDTEARTAINSIRTLLINCGLMAAS